MAIWNFLVKQVVCFRHEIFSQTHFFLFSVHSKRSPRCNCCIVCIIIWFFMNLFIYLLLLLHFLWLLLMLECKFQVECVNMTAIYRHKLCTVQGTLKIRTVFSLSFMLCATLEPVSSMHAVCLQIVFTQQAHFSLYKTSITALLWFCHLFSRIWISPLF